ncbi:related to transporter protein HOL1 [Ustilago trichophora]|uniref:Related to transporter protein HOL1 n=1 Tax=Ustilago trichophora TaxID=86804 RepID=A0A5C3EC52_9BASI|nr:related to transporter protein HOL1 [Ustilago trichophora]
MGEESKSVYDVEVTNYDADLKLEASNSDADRKLEVDKSKVQTAGTVQLTAGKIVYIPSPTADPRDPLNLPTWQKMVIIICLSLFSVIGLGIVSGFGGLLGFYIPEYASIGKNYQEISYFLSLPNLTMGIGNLIGMPIAVAVGRRSVFLVATAVMCISIGLCAAAGTQANHYNWHLGARLLLGIAAGQSEALVPMITQEIVFLHERARFLMLQQTIQVIAVAIFVLFASPIAAAIGPQWWYGIGCCLCGVCFIVAFFFLPETKYYRPQSDFQENATANDANSTTDSSDQAQGFRLHTERPPLDYQRYEPRTLRSSLRMWVGKPEWGTAWTVFKDSWLLVFLPNVFWALAINGVTLGCNIAIGMTYGSILEAAPYNWPHSSVSYANAGQIVTSLVALPVYGYGSDWIIKWFANRRGGIHEPETRLIPLFVPILIGVITAVLYGQGARHPDKYHWFTYAWALAAYFFTFIGANIVAITYLLDAYPQKASSLLIIICAFRGFLSFGVSFRVWDMIESMGYDGAFNMFAGLTALMGAFGVLLYFFGKPIRRFSQRFITVDDKN